MSAPAPAPQPIAVNFNVVIDASGNLEVFNAAAPVVGNVIVAEHTLPVYSLYDPIANKGLLELWEPESAQGDIYVQLADTDRTSSGGLNLTSAYQVASKAIAAGLEEILCDEFDCSGAAPFSSYTGNVEYYKQRDFGRVALATYAHHLFGHVDATAAITNDKAFVEAMLSTSAGGDDETAGGAAVRYAAWTKSTTPNVQLWDVSSSSSDANLALRLVKTLVQKGLDGNGVPIVSAVSAGNPDSLANIVSQVVGQDASRLMNVDNSQRTRDQHILLRFYPGDVIYMNITVKAPNVSIGATNQLVSKAALEALYPVSNNNFTVKITLAGPTPDYIESVVNDTIQSVITSPSTADITQLKAFLGGFTTGNPAPVQSITVENVPISALVTNAAGSFNTSQNYEVNFVLLTNNSGVINTVDLAEDSVLYIPTTSGTPVSLLADGVLYTVTANATSITINDVTYNLGQKVTLGNKQFLIGFTGSIGLQVKNASPGIAKLATRMGNAEQFNYSSIACDSLGNVYVRVRANGNGFTIYNYSSAPVNGGEIPTSVYGTISGGSYNYLIKYNSSGECQWAIKTPYVADLDGFNKVACDSENNVYICGTNGAGAQTLYNFSSAPVNGGEVGLTQYGVLPTPNNQGWAKQAYLVKYNPNGTVAWATRTLYIGGTDMRAHSLTVDKNNNVYFGFCDQTAATGGLAFYSYSSAPATSTSDIGTTLYGNFRPAVSLTTHALIITKYNSAGQIQYVGCVKNVSMDHFPSLASDFSGNLYVVAPINTSSSTLIMNQPVVLSTLGANFDFTQSHTMNIGGTIGAGIIKFSPTGVVEWATCQQFPIWYTRQPTISVDGNNNVYVVTTMLNSGPSRQIMYKNFSSISGSQIVTTNYGTMTIGDGTAVHICKLGNNGIVQWVTKIEGENVQFAFNSVVDLLGNTYIAVGHALIGSAGSPRLFNYSSAPVSQGEIGVTQYGKIQNVGGQDAYLVKYNTNGSVVWGTRVAGTLDEQSCEIALDPTDHVWITGIYRSNPITVNNYVAAPASSTANVTLEPFGTLADINTGAGINNVFLVKYGC